MYFFESTGGAQIIDKTDDYTAYFITSFEGMTNMEINDPYWCTTKPDMFKGYLSDNCSFIRFKFKSGLKLRLTISRYGPHTVAFGGNLIGVGRVYPLDKDIKKFDYESIEFNYNKQEGKEFINQEIRKINFEKINLIVERIVRKRWTKLIKPEIDYKLKSTNISLTHNETGTTFYLERHSTHSNLECKSRDIGGIIKSLRSLKSQKGYWDRDFKGNVGQKDRIDWLILEFPDDLLSKKDYLLEELRNLNMFGDIRFVKNVGSFSIFAPFKNFVLKTKLYI